MAIFRRLATIVRAGVLLTAAALSLAACGDGAEAPGFAGVNRPFIAAEPRTELPDLAFTGPDGAEMKLSDLRGKVVLLNLWATWCAPCVREMPSLERLQAALGGDGFQVVALSLDRGGKAQVEPFYMETGIEHLPMYLDPKMTAMQAFKPAGLPTTLLIDADGREIGRLEGEAHWDSQEAIAFISHFLPGAGRR